MKHIWAPWRMDYIEDPNRLEGCLFCTRLEVEDGPKNLVLQRGKHSFVMLNLYPYTNGHMMVVPFAHVPSLENLEAETLMEMMGYVNQAIKVLRKTYQAASFNVGVNIGEAAGAGVVDHVHMHVLPRWPGDTNFMATTSETRVIPESIRETYQRLLDTWQEHIG